MAARGSEHQAAGGWPSGSPEGENWLSWKLQGFRRRRACFSLRASCQPPPAAAWWSRLLSAPLPAPHPQQRPRDTGSQGNDSHQHPPLCTQPGHSPNPRVSVHLIQTKKTECLAKAVHSLHEAQCLHVGGVQRASPNPMGRPVLPSLVAPRGARPCG